MGIVIFAEPANLKCNVVWMLAGVSGTQVLGAIFHTGVPYIINGSFFRFLGQFRGPRTPLTSSLSRHADVNDRIVSSYSFTF